MKPLPKHSAFIFVTGAVILGIELTASRYMSPMFGSSLYIWGAILSVTLVCLSAGYSLGGRMGEKLEQPVRRLVLFVAFSAGWVGVIPFLQRPIAQLGLMAGPSFGPLLVMTSLFALPILLLATATPLVFADNIKSEVKHSHSPSLMGDLFAISTVGSVAGALLSAYLLIPSLGLRATLFVLSLALFLSCARYVLKGYSLRTTTSLIILVMLAQFIYSPEPEDGLSSGYSIIHRESSRYGELTVLDYEPDGSRLLLLDGTSQNWVSGKSFNHSLFEYTSVILAQLSQYPSTNKRVLVLGLGAGVLSRNLTDQGYEVESVELDPRVLALATRYFSFPADERVHLMDGRRFIEAASQNGTTYGAVILDVAGGGSQPIHLFNVEAFSAIADILAPDGVLLSNQLALLGPGKNDLAVHTMVTLEYLFAHVRGFDCYPKESDERLTNFVIAASQVAPVDPGHRSLVREILWEPDPGAAEIISDNWNPSDLWANEINRQWHLTIIDRLGYGAVIPI